MSTAVDDLSCVERHTCEERGRATVGATIRRNVVGDLACVWCDRAFRSRRTGGRAQRFCRPSCRRQFHAAARRWALDAIGAGMLSVGDIKTGFQRTRALLQASSELVGVTRSEGLHCRTPITMPLFASLSFQTLNCASSSACVNGISDVLL